jgi:hypothetical protein
MQNPNNHNAGTTVATLSTTTCRPTGRRCRTPPLSRHPDAMTGIVLTGHDRQ